MKNERLEKIIRSGKADSITAAINAASKIESESTTLAFDPSGERLVSWETGRRGRQELAIARFRKAIRLFYGYTGEEESYDLEPGCGSWREQARLVANGEL